MSFQTKGKTYDRLKALFNIGRSGPGVYQIPADSDAIYCYFIAFLSREVIKKNFTP